MKREHDQEKGGEIMTPAISYSDDYQTDYPALYRFILKGFFYALYVLFVVVDGLNNPESFEARLLTIPYFVGGLALVRGFCEAIDQRYNGHAAIFAMGISTLSALT